MAPPTLVWASEAVIHCNAAGRYWTAYPILDSQISAIRHNFDHVRLCLRCEHREPVGDQAIWLEDFGTSVGALPAYRGVGGFVRSLPGLVRDVWREVRGADAVAVRLPGPIGSLHALIAIFRGKPFSVHMVGDPDDVLGSEGFRTHERMLRLPLVWLTRILCSRAVACAYVTDKQLQRRYPAARSVPIFPISNVILGPADFGEERSSPEVPARLCFCGSLEQRYKGLDILLDAIARLRDAQVPTRLNVLGSGRHHSHYVRTAQAQGISDLVTFHGSVSREKVVACFRNSDLFVMPSRTEGLPRAMIEAMAQGLPCIGTDVGGIPELLDDAALVPVDDSVALSNRIGQFLAERQLYSEQSARNLERSRRFLAGRIDERRQGFYSALRAAMDRPSPK